jgi:hypothetical protein
MRLVPLRPCSSVGIPASGGPGAIWCGSSSPKARRKTVSRSMILSDVYGLHSTAKSNIINVYISYLRFKIDDGFELPLILTIRGKGYVLRGSTDHQYQFAT